MEAAAGTNLSRKKSLPDIAGKQAVKEPLMSREEVSVLSHNRRVEVRRMQEMAEMYRANPFLYFTNPEVKVKPNIQIPGICTTNNLDGFMEICAVRRTNDPDRSLE